MNTVRSDYLPKDLRMPLPGDMLVSEEVRRQIERQDPNKLLVNTQAVQSYFIQAWTAYNEITQRPEIKSGAGDIGEPPMLMIQSVPAVSQAEQNAFDAWWGGTFNGRPLAEIQSEELDNLSREIRDFLGRRGVSAGGDDDDEGPGGTDAFGDFMEGFVENEMIADTEEARRFREETFAKIRSGEIRDAGDILLYLTYFELDQINKKLAKGLEFKEQLGRATDLVPEDGPEGQPPDPLEAIRLNARMMEFSGDANQINFVMQNLLSNKERLITMITGLDKELGKVPETVGQALQRIS